MSKAVPVLEEDAPQANATEASLMTPLGMVEGDVLGYLDRYGIATLRQLKHDLKWPADMVMMAVGALVRAGLVRGIRHRLEVVVKPRKSLPELRSARLSGSYA